MSTKIKEVYVITEGNEEHNRWLKIGVAFVNKDNSINVVLDAIPINGRLHIRDKKEKKGEGA